MNVTSRVRVIACVRATLGGPQLNSEDDFIRPR